MAIHKDFPTSPYEILDPKIRWFPADEALRASSYEKLMPPLVHQLRQRVAQWRKEGYAQAGETSKALLKWWFGTEHIISGGQGEVEFQYYFSQREAVETVIYLYEVAGVKDKYDLINTFKYTGKIVVNVAGVRS